MRNKRRILIIAVAIIFGGLALFALVGNFSEPVYKGKKLTVWLERYRRDGVSHTAAEKREADEAVLAIGAEAVPMLLRRMRETDADLKWRLIRLAKKQSLIKVGSRDPNSLKTEAWVALCKLGPVASNAVPEIIQIYGENNAWATRPYCLEILTKIGPAAAEAVPLFLKETTSTNVSERFFATIGLGTAQAPAESAVPALIPVLKDPSGFTRFEAIKLLGDYGPAAKPAVPALLEFIRTERDKSLKYAVISALAKIDPEAAAKVVVE